ncbi:zinc ribbon domain-containing protein [Natrinema sp. HArc-T2]|uniref:DUF7575 domain-containing protein n=1 Tax=Natrinema sp. HArc-T2 TaxID=3242701 RepID=UPI00359DCE0D
MTWLRAILAAGLSVILPGAGHVLARDWLRAAVFAGLFLAASAFLLPIEQLAAAQPASYDEAIAQATAMAEDTDPMAQFSLSFIALFAAIDATFRALGYPSGGDENADGTTCPHCGKDVDPDLEFCHWCTTRLEPDAPDPEKDS